MVYLINVKCGVRLASPSRESIQVFLTSGHFFKSFSVLGSPKADISFTKPAGDKRDRTRNKKASDGYERGGISIASPERKRKAFVRLRRTTKSTPFQTSAREGVSTYDMHSYYTTTVVQASVLQVGWNCVTSRSLIWRAHSRAVDFFLGQPGKAGATRTD